MVTVGSKTAVLTGLMVLSSLLFLSGCLPLFSLQGLCTDDTVVFEEKLLGKWYGEDQTWNFTRNGENKYTLEVVQEGGLGKFEVHLVKLQDKLFLDLYPEKNDDLENTAVLYQVSLLPLHVIIYAEQIDDQLALRLVKFDKLLEKDPNIIEHVEIDDCQIITAQPRRLQDVLMDNFNTEKVIDKEQHVFYRGTPLFSSDNIVFSENLLGQWQSQDDDDDDVIIDCIGWKNGYDIVILADHREFWFKAYRVTMEQQSYLAVFAADDIDEELELYPDFLFRIEQEDSSLKFYRVDLYKSMESGKVELKEDDILVFDKQ
jgi:hypothetical protein